MSSKEGASCRSASDDFNERHPKRSRIDHSTARRVIQRFEQTGSVLDRPRFRGSRSATVDAKRLE
jgi:transposase